MDKAIFTKQEVIELLDHVRQNFVFSNDPSKPWKFNDERRYHTGSWSSKDIVNSNLSFREQCEAEVRWLLDIPDHVITLWQYNHNQHRCKCGLNRFVLSINDEGEVGKMRCSECGANYELVKEKHYFQLIKQQDENDRH